MSKVVVCGYTRDAIARVFSLPDCVLLHELKCIPEGARLGFCGGQVCLELQLKHQKSICKMNKSVLGAIGPQQ